MVNKRVHRLAWRWILFPAFGLAFVAVPIYDANFPVVTEWRVTDAQIVLGDLRVFGIMTKSEYRRHCKTDEFYAIVERRGLPKMIVEVKTDKTKIHTRPAGRQAFGPWFIDLPPAAMAVDIFTRHKCWPFLNTDRVLPVWRRGV